MSRVEVVAIGPHTTRFDGPAHPIRSRHVARPQTGTQTIHGVVGKRERLVLVLESRHRQDRPEDLLLEYAHLVVSLQDGRFVVVATRELPSEVVALAADQKLSAFIKTDLDIALDLLELGLRHLRADLGLKIERAVLPHRRNARQDALHEGIVDRLLNQRPRWAGANLPFVEGVED